jgi:sterol 3beta-glucosyltransferase
VKRRAVELANAMKNEDGVVGAVNAFYKHFPDQSTDTEAEPMLVAPVHKKFSIRGCFGY